MNELGKTFMPYTQSNYRMHPMVSSCSDKRGKGARFLKVSKNFSRVTGGPIGSRLWMRLLALSVEKMVILPTNVQR